jgi:hypothetical protein
VDGDRAFVGWRGGPTRPLTLVRFWKVTASSRGVIVMLQKSAKGLPANDVVGEEKVTRTFSGSFSSLKCPRPLFFVLLRAPGERPKAVFLLELLLPERGIE